MTSNVVEMMEESCLICDTRLSEGEVLTVKEQGLKTFTASSKKGRMASTYIFRDVQQLLSV
jgi:hypothetical protein